MVNRKVIRGGGKSNRNKLDWRLTLIIGLIIGIIISVVGVYAATLTNSKDVVYDNSNSTLTSTNVQSALDELYTKSGGKVTGKGTIYYEMDKQAQSDKNIDFSKASSDTNGKGVYKLSSSINYKYPILYYRGAVTNNNVIFANFCWKIVRTTETGGIKLIYNGVPSNGTCNNTGTNNQIGTSAFNDNSGYNNMYVGYMYGTAGSSTYEATHKNTNNSTIKTYIDSWYKNNMTSYTSKLEDAIWCNDRSISSGTGIAQTSTEYGGLNRWRNSKIPNLLCLQNNDKFTVSSINGNGALTYPVGLITVDEIVYAGSGSSSSFLYSKYDYWTNTPSSDDYVLYFDTEYGIDWDDSLDYDKGVRPCISLNPGTIISSGTGESSSPYIIK